MAGNDARLRIWPEAIHGFNMFPLAMPRAANEEHHAFLRDALA